MLKIGICDDDEREIEHIKRLIEQYQQERGCQCSCTGFQNPALFLEQFRGGAYDVILLDVLMPGLNGIQTAHEIRIHDQKVKLLFLSTSPEYAVDSYAVGAFHYLLKPTKPDLLFPLLDKVLEGTRSNDDAGLAVKSRNGLVNVAFSRLEFVEVMSKTVAFHLSDGSVVETFGTLAAHESQLVTRPEFLKVHRSFLVNLAYIETLDRHMLITRLSHQIPIARTLYTQVKEDYMRYLFAEKQADFAVQTVAAPALSPRVEAAAPVEPAAAHHWGENRYRILLVDDDQAEQQRWGNILRQKRCQVQCAGGLTEAEEYASKNRFDCVLLGICLPGENNFSCCQALSAMTGAPVIVLSCFTDPQSQLQAFSSGCTDYITKDTPPELFWAKIHARLNPIRPKVTQLAFGPLVLNLVRREVSIDGKSLIFTPTEFDLLQVLADDSSQVYSPEALYQAVWGAPSLDEGQSVQVHMSRLRRKLDNAYAEHSFIETVWGEGYRFVPPPSWQRQS